MKRKLITFDWAIKRLLRSKANFGILEGFLSELLKEEITILDVLESEANQQVKQDKINRFNDVAKDTLDEWIYFLKNEEIKDSFTAKGLKEAQETLSIMKLPEEEQKAYDHYQDDLHYQASMFQSTFVDGYESGKEEGKIKEKEQMVLNSYHAGLELTVISQITQLSIEKVQEIIEANGV